MAQSLRQQNAQLQEQLNEAQNLLETEKEEKLTALLRNAEISQSEEILRKELRIERDEANELHEKNEQLMGQMEVKTEEIKLCKAEMEELKTVMYKNDEKLKEIDEMHREISEKNKVIFNTTLLVIIVFIYFLYFSLRTADNKNFKSTLG